MNEFGTSFVFVQIPRCKPYPGCEQNLMRALGPNAHAAIPLAANTRSACPDEGAFRHYMIVLRALGAGRLTSDWMNPFNSREQMHAEDARVEFLATVWNYLSVCQSAILSLDETSIDELKRKKKTLATMNGLVCAYDYLARQQMHHVFTTRSGDFLKAYQAYLTSLYQLAFAVAGKLKRGALLRTAQTCLEQTNLMERSLYNCEGEYKTFFKVITELVRKYFRGYCHYQLGMLKLEEGKYGEAIAAMEAGETAIGAFKNDAFFATNLVSAVSTVKSMLHSKAAEIRYQNNNVYRQAIPDVVDFPSKALPLVEIAPEAEIMEFAGVAFGAAPPGYKEVPPTEPKKAKPKPDPVFVETPTAPVFTPPGSKSGLSDGEPPKRASGPPAFTPAPGPPAFTPAPASVGGAPVFTPAPSAGGPPVWTPPTDELAMDDLPEIPSGPPGQPVSFGSSEEDAFPMWGIAKSLKEGVVERLNQLKLKKPDKLQMICIYEAQVMQAGATDSYIQAQIDKYAATPSENDAAAINVMVEKAIEFYNDVELRLDRIAES